MNTSSPVRPESAWMKSLGLVSVLLVFGLAACSKDSRVASQRDQNAAVPVLVATVQQRDMPLRISSIGTVEAFETVQVKTQVTGELVKVNFKEGQDVKRGDLLFELDSRPFVADLNKQQATLAKDIAQAAQARADAKRYQTLLQQKVVSAQQCESMQTAADAADAVVAADRATVENSKVQLVYTKIYSPVDGRTGSLIVNRGNMVKANDTISLVVINRVNPIYVTFTVPQQYLADIKHYMSGGRSLAVEAGIQNDTRPAVGELSFIDNTVDTTTGTIKLKGTFPNADRRLWPGQYVNVKLTLTNQPNQIVVPSQALLTGQQGQYVFVVKSDKTVESRLVSVGSTIGQDTVVAKGLQSGEIVVTDGQLRLVPNGKVEIKAADAGAPISQPNQPIPGSVGTPANHSNEPKSGSLGTPTSGRSQSGQNTSGKAESSTQGAKS